MAIDLVNVALGTGGFVIHGRMPATVRLFGLLGRGHQRRRLRRPHHRGALCRRPGAAPARATLPATATWCSARPAGFGAAIDLAATSPPAPAASCIHGADADDWSGCSVSSAGDINGDGFDDLIVGAHCADGPGRHGTRTMPATAMWCSARPAASARDRSRAMSPRGTGGFVIHGADARRSVRPFGLLGRRHQRRRLRRPDRRGVLRRRSRRDAHAHRAGDSYVVFGKAGGVRRRDRSRDVAAGTGGFVIHGADAGD